MQGRDEERSTLAEEAFAPSVPLGEVGWDMKANGNADGALLTIAKEPNFWAWDLSKLPRSRGKFGQLLLGHSPLGSPGSAPHAFSSGVSLSSRPR